MKSFRVALLANLKTNAPHFEGMPEDQWADLDSEKTVNSLIEAIRSGGHSCEFLEGDVTLIDTEARYHCIPFNARITCRSANNPYRLFHSGFWYCLYRVLRDLCQDCLAK